jgi:hypothetical protein
MLTSDLPCARGRRGFFVVLRPVPCFGDRITASAARVVLLIARAPVRRSDQRSVLPAREHARGDALAMG